MRWAALSPPENIVVDGHIALVVGLDMTDHDIDRWCTVGSANLNEHSLEQDGELNVQVPSGEVARALRPRLWAEHLGTSVAALASSVPCRVVHTAWAPQADAATATIRARSGPLTGMAVRYAVGRMPGDVLVGALQAAVLDG